MTHKRTLINVLLALLILGTLAACAQPTPAVQIQEKVVKETVVVEQEKVVKETVVVEQEKEVVVTATPAEETTLERARREGVIRVGFANESPYAYGTPDGRLTGESVEVARAIFQALGIPEMDGVLTEWASLIPGLQAGRFDAITAGMFILPERCEQVLFGDPDYSIRDALIVEQGNPFDLHSFEDIAANPEVTVGTGAGYSSVEQMKAVGVTDDQMVLFPDGPSGIAGLQAGRIDVWTSTAPACNILLQNANDPNLELAEPFEPPVIDGKPIVNYGAVAFRYEDLDLREAYNEELAKLKESGELLEILSQFPGFGENTLPGDVTAEDVCPDAYADIGG